MSSGWIWYNNSFSHTVDSMKHDLTHQVEVKTHSSSSWQVPLSELSVMTVWATYMYILQICTTSENCFHNICHQCKHWCKFTYLKQKNLKCNAVHVSTWGGERALRTRCSFSEMHTHSVNRKISFWAFQNEKIHINSRATDETSVNVSYTCSP